MSYTLRSYAGIISDVPRIKAYREALKKHITPSSLVLDLGAGPGIFSLLACQLGAKHVYAVESNPAIQLGPELARDNGFEERITFYEADSLSLDIPEKVDLIVSDIRGVLPLFGNSLKVVSDAVSRFLKPGGVILPQTDYLEAALVSSKEAYQETTAPFEEDTYGLDLSTLQRALTNTWKRRSASAEDLMSDIICWHVIDYSQELSSDLKASLVFKPTTTGLCHGFQLWFRTVLTDGVSYTSGPGAEVTSYDSAFFPFSSPLEVRPGQNITVELTAKLVANEHIWSWNTYLGGPDSSPLFQQSSFFSDLIPANRLTSSGEQ